MRVCSLFGQEGHSRGSKTIEFKAKLVCRCHECTRAYRVCLRTLGLALAASSAASSAACALEALNTFIEHHPTTATASTIPRHSGSHSCFDCIYRRADGAWMHRHEADSKHGGESKFKETAVT